VVEVGSLSLFGLSQGPPAPPYPPLFYFPLAFSICKANPICSVPLNAAAAVYAASVPNSTKAQPLDLPSYSNKILTFVTVPHFAKKAFISFS